MPEAEIGSTGALIASLARALRPLVRLMIRRNLTFPAASALIKRLFVEEAARAAGPDATDSRLSLLTGLQRRDVKALRTVPPDTPARHGILPRVIGQWLAEGGRAMERPALEALIRAVSQDMHPRSVIDELLRQGAASEDNGVFSLTDSAWLPEDDADRLGYLGANLGDHGAVAAANVTQNPPPFFERAVHYNRLSPTSLARLDELARTLHQDALARLNAEAAALQQADRDDRSATGRFRAGAYVFTDKGDPA